MAGAAGAAPVAAMSHPPVVAKLSGGSQSSAWSARSAPRVRASPGSDSTLMASMSDLAPRKHPGAAAGDGSMRKDSMGASRRRLAQGSSAVRVHPAPSRAEMLKNSTDSEPASPVAKPLKSPILGRPPAPALSGPSMSGGSAYAGYGHQQGRLTCFGAPLLLQHQSFTMRVWDVWTCVLLLCTCVLVPYQISFLADLEDQGPVATLSLMLDVSFLLDIFVNMVLPKYDVEAGRWVTSNRGMAVYYLRSYFAVDFVSALPWDQLVRGVLAPALDLQLPHTSVDDARYFHWLYLFVLLKLLRLVRLGRLLERWRSSLGFSNSTLSLARFAIMVFVVAHWSACAFHAAPALSQDAAHSWLANAELVDAPTSDRFMAALYWSVTTLTTIGYGDISATTTAERFTSVLCMTSSGLLYSYVIGALYYIISNFDRAGTQLNENMDGLNAYMSEIALPHNQRRELREYFTHCKSLHRLRFYNSLLKLMSPQLRSVVAQHTHSGWLQNIPFFNAPKLEERQEFLSEVAVAMEPAAFAPMERVVKSGHRPEHLMVIVRGLATRKGRVITVGAYFGTEIITVNQRVEDSVLALSYLDVYALSKVDLDRILQQGNFAATKRKIKRAAMCIALRREFLRCEPISRVQRTLLWKIASSAAISEVRTGPRSDGVGGGRGSTGGAGGVGTLDAITESRATGEEESTRVRRLETVDSLDEDQDLLVGAASSGDEGEPSHPSSDVRRAKRASSPDEESDPSGDGDFVSQIVTEAELEALATSLGAAQKAVKSASEARPAEPLPDKPSTRPPRAHAGGASGDAKGVPSELITAAASIRDLMAAANSAEDVSPGKSGSGDSGRALAMFRKAGQKILAEVAEAPIPLLARIMSRAALSERLGNRRAAELTGTLTATEIGLHLDESAATTRGSDAAGRSRGFSVSGAPNARSATASVATGVSSVTLSAGINSAAGSVATTHGAPQNLSPASQSTSPFDLYGADTGGDSRPSSVGGLYNAQTPNGVRAMLKAQRAQFEASVTEMFASNASEVRRMLTGLERAHSAEMKALNKKWQQTAIITLVGGLSIILGLLLSA